MRKHKNGVIVAFSIFDTLYEMKSKTLEDIPYDDFLFHFNMKEAHLKGIRKYWQTDSIQLKFMHSELPITYETEEYRQYSYEVARRKYPYLFVDTNPLLYRKFYWSKVSKYQNQKER